MVAHPVGTRGSPASSMYSRTPAPALISGCLQRLASLDVGCDELRIPLAPGSSAGKQKGKAGNRWGLAAEEGLSRTSPEKPTPNRKGETARFYTAPKGSWLGCSTGGLQGGIQTSAGGSFVKD